MFMCELQTVSSGTFSKKTETLDEGFNWLKQYVNEWPQYTKAEIFCLERNQVVLALRVFK